MKMSDLRGSKAYFEGFDEACRLFKGLADSMGKIAAGAPPRDVERLIAAGAGPETAIRGRPKRRKKA